MASPELSSSILDAPEVPSRLPRPAATSRGFHHRSRSPPDAKTPKTGFLHLPDHVRIRIYKLAVFDHDRGAVFLPRGLPRKVRPDVDNTDIEYVDADQAMNERTQTTLYMPLGCEPKGVLADDSVASGRWVEEDNSRVAIVASLGLTLSAANSMTDKELLSTINDLDASDPAAESLDSEDQQPASSIADSDECIDLADWNCIEQTQPGWDDCQCGFHLSCLPSDFEDPEESDDSDAQHSEASEEELDIYLLPEEIDCDCEDADCNTCCSLEIHFEEREDPKRNIFKMDEDGENEDEEHFDTSELIGMLYEPEEPVILLACKEIRQECLPIYYRCDSFSWRFTWTDYLRSCLRFKYWSKSISTHDLSLMTKITFQGRHAVEEGVKFSIDIDLLDQYPFFETSVFADSDAAISDTLHRDMASYLWLMSQSVRKRPSFSAGHLCELANIFVQGMHRQVGQHRYDSNVLTNRQGCKRMLDD